MKIFGKLAVKVYGRDSCGVFVRRCFLPAWKFLLVREHFNCVVKLEKKM